MHRYLTVGKIFIASTAIPPENISPISRPSTTENTINNSFRSHKSGVEWSAILRWLHTLAMNSRAVWCHGSDTHNVSPKHTAKYASWLTVTGKGTWISPGCHFTPFTNASYRMRIARGSSLACRWRFQRGWSQRCRVKCYNYGTARGGKAAFSNDLSTRWKIETESSGQRHVPLARCDDCREQLSGPGLDVLWKLKELCSGRAKARIERPSTIQSIGELLLNARWWILRDSRTDKG